MRTPTIVASLSILAASFAPGHAKDGSELPSYKLQHANGVEKVERVREKKLATVGHRYAMALERLFATVKREGDLDKALAVQSEIDRFAKESSPPSEKANLSALRAKQEVYTREVSTIDREFDARVLAHTRHYEAVLVRLQIKLVRAGRIAKAEAVQSERKRIAPALLTDSISLARPAKGEEILVPVTSDRNILSHGRVVERGIYWGETDNKQGKPEFTFKDPRLGGFLGPVAASLRFHIADHRDAQSNGRFDIYCGKRRLGRILGAKANRWIEVDLESEKLPRQEQISLRLIARTADGLAVSSKASGFGAELRLKF